MPGCYRMLLSTIQSVVIPVLEMGKLRHRELHDLAKVTECVCDIARNRAQVS